MINSNVIIVTATHDGYAIKYDYQAPRQCRNFCLKPFTIMIELVIGDVWFYEKVKLNIALFVYDIVYDYYLVSITSCLICEIKWIFDSHRFCRIVKMVPFFSVKCTTFWCEKALKRINHWRYFRVMMAILLKRKSPRLCSVGESADLGCQRSWIPSPSGSNQI